MKIPLTTFLPDVAVHLPGCPQPIIEHHAIRVLADFGRKTRYETELLPTIDVVAGQGGYAIASTDATMQVVRVEQAWFNGETLSPVTADELDAEIPDWRIAQGTPRLYVAEDEGSDITLVPVPDTDTAAGLRVKVSVALNPLATVTEFNSTLYRRFGDGIAAGIRAWLQLIPNKEWSSPEHAVLNATAYQVAVSMAAQEADKQRARTRQRTRSYYR